jgi:hypothetical protein
LTAGFLLDLDLNQQLVAWIDLLVENENLVNVERTRGPVGQTVPQHLKKMLQPCCIVDVDVSNTVVFVHEESKLKIAIAVLCLKTAGARVTLRRMMQRAANRSK